MKLSNRIKILLNVLDIKEGNIYYDIGCDHGIIGYNILLRTTTAKVVFSDISKTCLDKAKALCENAKYNDRVQFIQADGVCKNASSDGIGIIFGLGGETIIDILSRNEHIEEFYLQPTTSVIKLREYIYKKCYCVLLDKVYFDRDKPIVVIHIKKSDKIQFFDAKVMMLGRDNVNRKDKQYLTYLRKQKNILSKMLANIDENMLTYNVDNYKIVYHEEFYKMIDNILKGDKSG